MSTSDQCRVALFDSWPHTCGDSYVTGFPTLSIQKLDYSLPVDDALKHLADTQIYQIRSTRSELHESLWADEPLLSRCPNLLAVSTTGSGYDTVNLEACTNAGVLAVNQAGGNKQAVAEHAFGMMLCLSKQIIQSDRAMRRQSNVDRETYTGRDVRGKTLGVVGLGQVGTHVAELATRLFDMRVLAYDPYISDEEFANRCATQTPLPQLLEESDFVTVHCPRNKSSEHLFDAEAFKRMKPGAFFVSTARGGVHDEQALANALQQGSLAGAGVDVWEQEPPTPDHPLLQLDNVIASPHNAGVTHEARENIVRITIDQLDVIARGERPPRLLNPEVWERYLERREKIHSSL